MAIITKSIPIPSYVKPVGPAKPPVKPSGDPQLDAIAAGVGFSIPSADTPSAKPVGPLHGATGLEMHPQPNVIRRV